MADERFQDWRPRIQSVLADLPKTVDAEIVAWAAEMRSSMKSKARRKTGALAKSITVEHTGGLGGDVVASSDDPAAAVAEFGGPIKPTAGAWLAIPLRDDIRALGTARADAGLFVLRARDGRMFLASRSGGSLDLRWKLQRSVQRAASPTMRPTFAAAQKALGPRLARTMRDKVVR